MLIYIVILCFCAAIILVDKFDVSLSVQVLKVWLDHQFEINKEEIFPWLKYRQELILEDLMHHVSQFVTIACIQYAGNQKKLQEHYVMEQPQETLLMYLNSVLN